MYRTHKRIKLETFHQLSNKLIYTRTSVDPTHKFSLEPIGPIDEYGVIHALIYRVALALLPHKKVMIGPILG